MTRSYHAVQRADGRPAEGPTAEEFRDVMQVIKTKMERIARRYPASFPDGVLYSFDNPPIHTSADLTSIGIEDVHRVRLPARSPDFHKVVEHALGNLKREFTNRLRKEQPKTPKEYQQLLVKVFEYGNAVTEDGIRADVDSLEALYKIVAKPPSQGGTAGDSAPPEHR